ncbi:hypothetical protein CKN99_11685 [Carnobacterium maltaromaticum]|jgi:hypothetical protein|uniref:hypothetical protein n=1 Tax=Carnobacterium TaxID=2747 RepID=UPI000E73C727|nr:MULTISPECIES: hypothetical protein [Carnobacterium]AOA04213.1 hypothetical protein BFC23_16230 [Carnobacterium maltaromaticum]MBQ6485280.1 hypothetical protein [Carnobacterium sp.]MDT1946562.1 hypothetical protein [Carnobacterium maltaromaticum]MDT2000947.1 hypothetical protein [Carnobacterium maltaromaticum]TFJ25636.1 hypothetical protein CKN90_11640 [Carnobacterium maltaromaticum]
MKKKKLIMLVSAGVLAIGIVGGGVYVAQANSAVKTEEKKNEADKELEKSVDGYLATIYTDKTYTDVKDNVEQKTIDDAKRFTANKLGREMNKATRKKLYELVTAPQMVYVKNTIAGMYESEGVAKSTLNEKDFDKLNDLIKQLQDKKEVFAKKETEKLNVAKASFKQAKDVENQVNSFFDKETVKDDVTREAYQTALDNVTALKQVTLKESLTAKLVLVDTKLSEKEQAVVAEEQAVQAQQEVQAKAEQEKASAATNNSNVQNGDNSSNAGYTDNSSSNSTPPTGGSQGNNSNSGATQQPSAPAPVQPSNPSPGTTWNGTPNGEGGVINGQNNDNGTGTHNEWEGGDWDYN